MSAIRIAVSVVYIALCLFVVFLVFKGKGDGADLSGGIAGGSAETYYTKHGKKNTEDALRIKMTVAASAAFIVLSLILNMGWGY